MTFDESKLLGTQKVLEVDMTMTNESDPIYVPIDDELIIRY